MSILFSHLTDISYKKMLLFLILKFLGLIGIILNASSKAFLLPLQSQNNFVGEKVKKPILNG